MQLGVTGYAQTLIHDNGAVGNIFVGEHSGDSSINSTGYSGIGGNNAANGYKSLLNNDEGHSNVANGSYSMYYNTSGMFNVSNGSYSMHFNTSGRYNVANGAYSLYSNIDGWNNAANGFESLRSNKGSDNVANGFRSLYRNISGYENTANGHESLFNNHDGFKNTANGKSSLYSNNSGNFNVASGYQSLYKNTSGYSNTATGSNSLYSNTDGFRNTAMGASSLYFNKGDYNTANGNFSLYNNIGGSYNVASGHNSLLNNSSGNSNTAVGTNSLNKNKDGIYNVASGAKALFNNVSGHYNTAIGYNSGPAANTTGNKLYNTTAIGNGAVTTADNQVRIGNTTVASIGGYQTWSKLSDGRFKEAVKEDVSGLEFVNKLRPVSYTVNKKKLKKFLGVEDSKEDGGVKSTTANNAPSRRHTGFIAQEVEAIIKETGYVFNGVDVPQNENDHYSIRYAEFVMPLVKSVQELSANAEVQSKEIEVLTTLAKTQAETIAKQQEQITALLANSKNDAVSESIVNSDAGIQLFQNRPNPFTVDTNIEMELSSTTVSAKILIYNLEGREIKSIIVENRGKTRVQLSARELNAGMYIYALVADGKVIDTKRMILTK